MSTDIYTIPGPTDDGIYENLRVSDPGKTAQHGGFKKKFFKVAEVCACLLLLAGIIVLAVLYGASIKDKNIQQSRLNNMTEQTDHSDKLLSRLNNMTEQRDQVQTELKTMTGQRDQVQTELNDMTRQRNQLQTGLKTMTDQRGQLQTRLNNMTELKKILCESNGFTFGGGVCYYISAGKKTWIDSRAYCTAKQSDLMTIKSKEKQDFVGRVVGKGKIVWIGLTDREREGVWNWVDGRPLTTPKYWRPGEPNDTGGQEDCADFSNGIWNDSPCGDSTNWICEKHF